MTAAQIEVSMKDSIFKNAYGPNWKKAKKAKLFWSGFSWLESTTEPDWDWSNTFGCWGAVVTLSNGWHGYTYPQTK